MEFAFLTLAQMPALVEIYNEAFPRKERRPIANLKKGLRQGRAVALGAFEGDKLLGFLYATKQNRLNLIDYLAVAHDGRGKGVGSALLEEFAKRREGERMVLLIEAVDPKAENFKQRLARKRFYVRSGYAPCAFRVSEIAGDMEVMSFGGNVKEKEFLDVTKLAYGPLFFALSKTKTHEIEG